MPSPHLAPLSAPDTDDYDKILDTLETLGGSLTCEEILRVVNDLNGDTINLETLETLESPVNLEFLRGLETLTENEVDEILTAALDDVDAARDSLAEIPTG